MRELQKLKVKDKDKSKGSLYLSLNMSTLNTIAAVGSRPKAFSGVMRHNFMRAIT